MGGIWPAAGAFLPDQDARNSSYWLSTGSGGYFEDPELDRLVIASTTAVGAEARQRTAQAQYQFIYDNYSCIPLLYYNYIVAISNNVEYFPDNVGDEPCFMEYVKIKH